MPESSDQASQRQRRAKRIGVRTLRQRPKLVGALVDGEPVYEVRSVRLVLRGQTPHFNRLVACERCGQNQAGPPVLAPADLELPVRPMICADCVQRAGVSSVWEPEATRPQVERVSEDVQAPAEPPPPTAPGPEMERLEAIEHRLGAMGARVEQLGHLGEVQIAAQTERRRAEETARAALRADMSQALAGARSQIVSVSEELRQGLAGLSQVVEAQRIDLTVVVGEVAQARSEMRRQVGAAPPDAASTGVVVDERLQELAARIDALLDADRMSSTRLRDLEERLDRLAAELAIERSQESDRADATRSSASAEELATLQAAVDERLRELAAQVAQGTAPIGLLLDGNNETTGRLAGLEQRLERLAGQLAAGRPELTVGPPAKVVAAPGGNGMGLLDDLEVLLQGASDRLSAMGGRRPQPGDQPERRG